MRSAHNALGAAQRRLASTGAHHIGDLVSWDLYRVDVERSVARDVFATEGLSHLVPEMDSATALSRAALEVRRPSGIIVRPFAKPKGDTSAAVGVYLQHTRDGEAGDQFGCGARCRVDPSSGAVVALPPEGATGAGDALAHAEAMATHANHLLTHCETKDLSSAMVSMAKALSGVPLRDRGGFYLLPPSTCPTWARMKFRLEALGVRPIRIEMHDAPDNVSVARSAAQGALEADVAELLADLERAKTEGMRQHALTRRVDLCKELGAKAELYRGVLSGIADRIAARVQALQREFEQQLDADGASFAVAVND